MRFDSHVHDEISDFLDGRLRAGRREEIEEHLEICDDCRREWNVLASVKSTIREATTESMAPPALAAEIRSALDREDRAEAAKPLGRRHAGRFAALAAAAAAIVALVLLSIPRGTDPPTAVAHDWRRWTSGRLHLELRSESPQAISRFFADRGFAFRVPSEMIALPGYRLVGARVHSVAGRRSTFSVYRGGRNETVICQMYEGVVGDLPAGGRVLESGGGRLLLFRASNLTQVFWQDGSIVCVLVSDAPPEEIVRIALAKVRRA